jgi:hypothetical protein
MVAPIRPFRRSAAPRLSGAGAIAAALATALLLAAGPNSAAAQPSAQVFEYGLYEIKRVGRRPAPRTIGGWVGTVSRAKLIRKTDLVAGQLGRSFGMRVRFQGLPAGTPITVRTVHPPKTNPDNGRTMRVSEYSSRVSPSMRGLFLFTFDDRWELAEGKWSLQVVHDGEVIGRKDFKVVVPLN